MSISILNSPNNLSICSNNLNIGNVGITNDSDQKIGTNFTTTQLVNALQSSAGAGNINGTLLPNYLTVATSTNTIADSIITQAKTSITIGGDTNISGNTTISQTTNLNNLVNFVGPINYNINNTNFGASYLTYQPLYEFFAELSYTAGIPINTSIALPYPTGKKITDMRKLSCLMYNVAQEQLIAPENTTFIPQEGYSIAANSDSIVIYTFSTWVNTNIPVLFYVYISTI